MQCSGGLESFGKRKKRSLVEGIKEITVSTTPLTAAQDEGMQKMPSIWRNYFYSVVNVNISIHFRFEEVTIPERNRITRFTNAVWKSFARTRRSWTAINGWRGNSEKAFFAEYAWRRPLSGNECANRAFAERLFSGRISRYLLLCRKKEHIFWKEAKFIFKSRRDLYRNFLLLTMCNGLNFPCSFSRIPLPLCTITSILSEFSGKNVFFMLLPTKREIATRILTKYAEFLFFLQLMLPEIRTTYAVRIALSSHQWS